MNREAIRERRHPTLGHAGDIIGNGLSLESRLHAHGWLYWPPVSGGGVEGSNSLGRYAERA